VLRQRPNFISHFNLIWVVQIAPRKYSASHFPQISSIFAPSRLIEEGRTRRHDTWSAGCGGREGVARVRCCRAASGFVLGLWAIDPRRTSGVVAYGKSAWFWHPWLVSNRRRFSRAQPGLAKPSIRRRWRQEEFVSRESAP